MTPLQSHTSRPMDDRESSLDIEPWKPWQWAISFILLIGAVAPLVYGSYRVRAEDARLRELTRQTHAEELWALVETAKEERDRIHRMQAFYASEIAAAERRRQGKP